MNVVGIIAEYNPLHKGHAGQIAQAKELADADFCIVILSPDYVQRGEPAVADKFTRTRMALAAGADCVLELPVAFAVGAARTFAEAGVSLLDRTGVLTHLCFGSECGDLNRLSEIAEILAEEPASYVSCLRNAQKSGLSYPAASQKALEALLSPRTAALAASPNNLLGIEYLRALKRRQSSVRPITLLRTGDYRSDHLTGPLSSATALRARLEEQKTNPDYHPSRDPELLAAIQDECRPLFCDAYGATMPVSPDDFSMALNYRLLSLRNGDLTRFEDVSEDLANQILRNLTYLSTFRSFAGRLKTRQYTRTRINRALLHILLDITKEEVRLAQERDYGSYVRILGFRSRFAPCLTEIKKKSSLTLLTKPADAEKKLNPEDYALFRQTVCSSDLYRCVLSAKFGITPKHEYTQGILRMP